MKNRNVTFTAELLALAFVGLLPIPKAFGTDTDGDLPGNNKADGYGVMPFVLNSSSVDNSGFGFEALFTLEGGDFNTAIGTRALYRTDIGSDNTAVGAFALALNRGSGNTATGFQALYTSTYTGSQAVGSNNTANGANALISNTTGNFNTAIGVEALSSNTTGNNNTAIGVAALRNNITTGGSNVALGYQAGINLTTGNNNVCIGAGVQGVAGEGNTTRICNIGSTPIVGGTTVVIDALGGNGGGRLGYASSSRRYKEEIKPMDKASETLFALKPVTFRAKGNMDPAHVKHYGLIAEDVAAVDSDLVVYNPEGKPETLRFDSINAMLLNEFFKEHRKVQELEARLVQQQKDFTARLKEQDAKIQKVSAEVELKTATPQTVLNNQ